MTTHPDLILTPIQIHPLAKSVQHFTPQLSTHTKPHQTKDYDSTGPPTNCFTHICKILKTSTINSVKSKYIKYQAQQKLRFLLILFYSRISVQLLCSKCWNVHVMIKKQPLIIYRCMNRACWCKINCWNPITVESCDTFIHLVLTSEPYINWHIEEMSLGI